MRALSADAADKQSEADEGTLDGRQGGQLCVLTILSQDAHENGGNSKIQSKQVSNQRENAEANRKTGEDVGGYPSF